LIKAVGKNWLKKQETLIMAKGKGTMQTYWLEMAPKSSPATRSGSTECSKDASTMSSPKESDEYKWIHPGLRSKANKAINKQNKLLNEKTLRLVDWNTDVLCHLLKHIVTHCRAAESSPDGKGTAPVPHDSVVHTMRGMVINKVVEIIELPKLNTDATRRQVLIDEIELKPVAVQELRSYIHGIASLYGDNPFHSFEHVPIHTGDNYSLLCIVY
jgi:hypothetical protein